MNEVADYWWAFVAGAFLFGLFAGRFLWAGLGDADPERKKAEDASDNGVAALTAELAGARAALQEEAARYAALETDLAGAKSALARAQGRLDLIERTLAEPEAPADGPTNGGEASS